MKHKILILCAATMLLFSCSNETKDAKSEDVDSSGTTSSTDKKEVTWIPIDSAAGMKAMMEAGAPGEPHKMMAKSNGTWTAEVTMWMTPDGPPSKSKGTSVNSSLYDGRYQVSKFSANTDWGPMEGMSTMAYDNASKEYVSTWIDNMSTAIMVSRGTWDQATNSMNMTGTVKNPANGLDCTMREVFKMVDDNNQVMEMYGPDPKTGKEFKTLEIKYTRKK